MNFDPIHTDHTHFSEEDLYRYLEGALAPEEQKRREAHLKDCERCSDMLEGFESSGDLHRFRKDVEALRATIREKTQTRKKKSILFDQPFSVRTVVALAACLLAAVALSMFLFLQKEDFVKSSEISMAKKDQKPNSDGAISTPEKPQSPTPDQPVLAEGSREESKTSEPLAAHSEQQPGNTGPLRDAPVESNKNTLPQSLSEQQQPILKDKELYGTGEEYSGTFDDGSEKLDADYRKKTELAEIATDASAAAPKIMSAETPQPEGGYEALANYLQAKLASLGEVALGSSKRGKQQSTYGGKTRTADAIGRRAYFYVEPSGKLSDFEISGETDKQRIDKIIEVIRKGPTWKPAYKNGKPIRERVSVPIDY